MVDAGSRAASVTIQKVMDTEHGLGKVIGEIMLNTSLNHWIQYYGKPNIIRNRSRWSFFGIRDFDVALLQRASVLTLMVPHLGKPVCLEKRWIPSSMQQYE